MLDGNLYFTASGDSGRELYVVDDTAPEGARLIADVNMGSSNPQELTLVDGKIYFVATGNNATDGDVGQELYVYDPVTDTTTLAADIIGGPESSSPRQLTALGAELYFVADTYDANDDFVTELFFYDPRAARRSRFRPRSRVARPRANSQCSTANFISPPTAPTWPATTSAVSFTSTIP